MLTQKRVGSNRNNLLDENLYRYKLIFPDLSENGTWVFHFQV
jgi:hypothetical protein